MFTARNLVEDLRALGLSEGMHIVAHVSLRAIGPIDGGVETLVSSFRQVLGNTGTLMVPTFTPEFFDPAETEVGADSADELEDIRSRIEVFDPRSTPASEIAVGGFPEGVRRQRDSYRGDHPVLSFAAIGAMARALTEEVPFHYPLGSDSCLARLHQYKGWILLIGVGQESNAALHLAEVWADVPYIHRSALVKVGPDRWIPMQGSPGCTDGFSRIESILRQARITRNGQVGHARAQLMRMRETVSMAVAMLRGAGNSLLCSDPNCPPCHVAHKYTAESTFVAGQPV